MANKDNTCLWLCLPESLVLNIFSYLTSGELQRAGCTCRTWLRIAHDELLWKNLLYREWKINRAIPLPPGHSSYYREFRRLKYRVPTVCVQELTDHCDQVLHVSFSHNGKLFASCSKDGTIKVWKSGPPASLKYSLNMKEQFRWQFTQFSQFNSSDSLLLVSGVHFGPNSTSGEIAVFNLKEDFALQARVQNKPYDIFGCWLNNSYLLSGNLHYLGQLSSCSALWLNKATQEVDSEQESVVMRLFKFLNLNASTVRGITVASCRNLGKGKELLLKQLKLESSKDSQDGGDQKDGRVNERMVEGEEEKKKGDEKEEIEKETLMEDGESKQRMEEQSAASRTVGSSSESEADVKVSSAYESDTEMTASEPDSEQRHFDRPVEGGHRTRKKTLSQEGIPGAGAEPQALQQDFHTGHNLGNDGRKLLKHCSKTGKHRHLSEAALDGQSRTHPLKREASDASVTPPGSFRKSLRKDGEKRNSAVAKGECSVGGQKGTESESSGIGQSSDTESSHSRLWCRVRNAEMRRGRQNVDEDLMKILIYGVEPEGTDDRSSRHSPARNTAGPSTSHGDHHSLRNEEALSGVGSRCSSTDTILSSTDTDYTSLTFAGESGSGSDIVRAWGKKFTFGSTESLDEESLLRIASESRPNQSRTEQPAPSSADPEKDFANNLSSSSQSDSQEVKGQRSKVRRRRTLQKEDTQHKHLIFMRGAIAYTPHQICIKRIDPSMMDTGKGPLGVSKHHEDMPLGPAAFEENRQAPRPQLEFDKVDHVIDLHGQILGLALSPDHRFLCVNCRSWPKDYHVADALAPPPIAQEIEVRMFDLYTLMEVKKFRGHRAFSPNDECNIIFLSVSDQYVASGAEDRQGYIWDRHYGILLSRLPHTDMVNCVAFNPFDPEMLLTASDDHTLKIWYSRNRIEQTAGL